MVDSRSDRLNLSALDVWILCALGAVSFVFQVVLAFTFERMHLLEYGALWQTDPEKWIPTLVDGHGSPTLRHPLFQVFFYPITQLAGAVFGDNAREITVLLLSPTWSGIKAGAFFLTLRVLGCPRAGSALLSILGIVSLSQLVFGSIPDHMAISGALIALLFLQASLALRDVSFDRLWIWALLGVLTIGVTVSNAAIFFVIYGSTRLWIDGSAARAILRTVYLTIIASLASGAIALSARLLFWEAPADSYEDFWKFFHVNITDLLLYVTRYPLMLFYSIIGETPAVYHSQYYSELGIPAPTVFDYVLHKIPLSWTNLLISLLTIAITGAGLWLTWQKNSRMKAIALASVLVIAFNGVLHSFWGAGYFYYSQHWHAALLIALSGWLLAGRSASRYVNTMLIFIVAVCVARNVMLYGFILDTLAKGSLK